MFTLPTEERSVVAEVFDDALYNRIPQDAEVWLRPHRVWKHWRLRDLLVPSGRIVLCSVPVGRQCAVFVRGLSVNDARVDFVLPEAAGADVRLLIAADDERFVIAFIDGKRQMRPIIDKTVVFFKRNVNDGMPPPLFYCK